MDDPCVCGDAGDEHDAETMACTVCECFHYEADPAAWDDSKEPPTS